MEPNGHGKARPPHNYTNSACCAANGKPETLGTYASGFPNDAHASWCLSAPAVDNEEALPDSGLYAHTYRTYNVPDNHKLMIIFISYCL